MEPRRQTAVLNPPTCITLPSPSPIEMISKADHSRWVEKAQPSEKFDFSTAQANSRTAEHDVEDDANEEFFHDAVGARELSEEGV